MSNPQKRSNQQRWGDLQPSKTMLFWSCAGSHMVGFTRAVAAISESPAPVDGGFASCRSILYA